MILAAADREAEGRESSEDRNGAARGIAANGRLRARNASVSFGRAGAFAALRIAVGITGDFDLEKALEVGNALVELLADVDVLAVAEKRAVGLGARGFTTTLEVGFALHETIGLAADLAIHIGLCVARTRTTRLALGLAIRRGRSGFALGVAFAGARGFAGAMTTSAVGRAVTRGITRSAAFGATIGCTIKFAGVDLAL